MKQILEKIIDKNGGTLLKFNPSANMILFAQASAKSPHLSPDEILDSLALSKQVLKNWRNKYGAHFDEWFEAMLDQFTDTRKADVLEAVGMVHAVQGNYQFWRDMARTHGVIKEETKEVKITLNTDFSKFEGTNFEDYRRGLLESTRGVEYSPRPRVVEANRVGGAEGPGAGAIPVEARSVEVLDPLAEDRGQPELKESLSALSKRLTPIRSDQVLGRKQKATST